MVFIWTHLRSGTSDRKLFPGQPHPVLLQTDQVPLLNQLSFMIAFGFIDWLLSSLLWWLETLMFPVLFIPFQFILILFLSLSLNSTSPLWYFPLPPPIYREYPLSAGVLQCWRGCFGVLPHGRICVPWDTLTALPEEKHPPSLHHQPPSEPVTPWMCTLVWQIIGQRKNS